jgi:predicted nucleic acid-binding Zn ribbon protein
MKRPRRVCNHPRGMANLYYGKVDMPQHNLPCQACGELMTGVRKDKRWCSAACQNWASRRNRGEVEENNRLCTSCLTPLTGMRSHSTVCRSRKCRAWAQRHPGQPHPSVAPRICPWCGAEFNRKAGAQYCSMSCKNITSADRHRDRTNARERERYAADPQRREYQRQYQQDNRERRRQWDRDERARDPERYRAYYNKWLADPRKLRPDHSESSGSAGPEASTS